MLDLAETFQEHLQLADTYTRSAARVGEMVKAKKQLEEDRKSDPWAEELRAWLEEVDDDPECDLEDDTPGEAEGTHEELAKEIAEVRLVLRRTLAIFPEAESFNERLRLADVYGQSCARLVKLLKAVGKNQDRLLAEWYEARDRALRDIAIEKGLSI